MYRLLLGLGHNKLSVCDLLCDVSGAGSNTQQLAVYIEEGDDIVLNCTFPGARSVKEVKWKFYKNETETIVSTD